MSNKMKFFKKNIGIIIILLSLIIVYVWLNFAQYHILNRNEFALSITNTTRAETLDGYLISSDKFEEIKTIVKNFQAINCLNKSLLWVGNSQQHTINGYVKGDHLSIFWLATYLKEYGFKSGCVIGISLPNVNPQEILYLLQYLDNKGISFSNIIFPLEFMGYREFGVRDDVKTNLTDNLEVPEYNELKNSLTGNDDLFKSFTEMIEPPWLRNSDKLLDRILKANFPIWSNRLDIQSTFVMNLVVLRNRVFQIKSNSKRKSIPARMLDNINAFSSTVDFAAQRNINALFYFVPILPHDSFPYFVEEFNPWKEKLIKIIISNGFDVFDLTNLVDNEYWGSNFGDDIDFMHFGGRGHQILAEKIFEELRLK